MKRKLIPIGILVVIGIIAFSWYVFSIKNHPRGPLVEPVLPGRCESREVEGMCTITSIIRGRITVLDGVNYTREFNEGRSSAVNYEFSAPTYNGEPVTGREFIANDTIRRYGVISGKSFPCKYFRVTLGACMSSVRLYKFEGQGIHPPEKYISGTLQTLSVSGNILFIKSGEEEIKGILSPDTLFLAFDSKTSIDPNLFNGNDDVFVSGWNDDNGNYRVTEVRDDDFYFSLYGPVISIDEGKKNLSIKDIFHDNREESITVESQSIINNGGEIIEFSDIESGDILGIKGTPADGIIYNSSIVKGPFYFFATITDNKNMKLFIDNLKPSDTYYMYPRILESIKTFHYINIDEATELLDGCELAIPPDSFNKGEKIFFSGRYNSRGTPQVAIDRVQKTTCDGKYVDPSIPVMN